MSKTGMWLLTALTTSTIAVVSAACTGAPRDEAIGSTEEALLVCPPGSSRQCEPGLGGKLVCGCEVDPAPPPPPPPPVHALEVVASESHTCALTSDATVRCWGSMAWGGARYQGPSVPILANVAHIAGDPNSDALCTVTTSGTVQCLDNRPYPNATVAITTDGDPSLVGVRAVAMGDADACAIVGDGSVRCWGQGNIAGGLGRSAPTQIRNATALAVSSDNGVGSDVCGISGGAVWCQGNNMYRNAGLVQAPVPSASIISANQSAFCATPAPGQTSCWVSFRPAGEPDGGPWPPYLFAVPGITSLSIGSWVRSSFDFPRYAVDVAGDLWLLPTTGSTGNPGPNTAQKLPAPTALATVSAGFRHACAVDRAGAVYCWGDDTQGQLGGSSTTVPVRF